MPDSSFFITMLAAHLLGDFYFQSPAMANDKNTNYAVLLRHCLYYGLTLAVGTMLFFSPASCIRAVLWGVGTHAVIDFLKTCFWEDLQTHPKGTFLVDQLLHLSVLAAVSLYGPTVELSPALPWPPALPYEPEKFLRLLCLALFLGKPANIVLKTLNLKPPVPTAKETQPLMIADQATPEYQRAGATIGTLERFLTALLFLLEAYAAIAVVFAAKTLTRYDKITKDETFSEYYLIGTLGSLLLAIIPTLLLFPPQ